MLRIRRNRLVVATALIILSTATVASADEPEIESLIQIVKGKPAGMSNADWREKRRDAARQLGRLGDKRAVPALIDVVRDEKFDVVAEIAIEALGRLGDKRAVPVLRDLVDDSSRDKYVREAAKRALKRIGVKPTGNGGKKQKDDGKDLVRLGSRGSSILGDDARHDIPAGPSFDEDVIAATERLTFAAGDVGLRYDTLSETATFVGDVHGVYERVIEKQSVGYSYGGSADLAVGLTDPPGDDSNSSLVGSYNLSVNGEMRSFFGGGPLYGQIAGAASEHGIFIRNAGPNPNVKELRHGQDLSAALAVGRGRVFDVGEGLRLRRLEQVLAEARMLGRPITDDLAAKLLRTWWALRSEQGAHRRLQATVAILRDAGVLLGEPDAGTTYKILQVLLDGQLDHRLSGLDVRVGFSESYLRREEGVPAESLDGRFESLFAFARYGKQSVDGKNEIVGTGLATYRVLGEDGDPSPWAARAEVTWRRYFYGDAWDPIGALEFGGAVGASDDDIDGVASASRIEGSIGWAWAPSRATHYRLAGNLRLESGEMFVGITFTGAWGLLDAGYVTGQALPPSIP